MRVVVLLLCAACARPRVEPRVAPLVVQHLEGRVMLDGAPVTRFGITASHDEAGDKPGAVTQVKSPDGRFRIRVARGPQYVIVVGDGFARTIVKVDVMQGQPIPPVTIEVARGRRVEGIVTDGAGGPVANAVVELRRSRDAPTNDIAWEHARGNYTARTDATGRFELVDVVLPDGRQFIAPTARIRASRPPIGSSLPHELPAGRDHVVGLALVPVGHIQGAIASAPDGRSRGVVWVKDLALEGVVQRDGTFTIRDVPVGEWKLHTLGGSAYVTVMPGQTTRVLLRVELPEPKGFPWL